MATWVWVVIVIAVLIAIALGAVTARNRRTAALRGRFGPEYDRAIENSDDRRAAEADLLARQKERAQFDVEPLPEAARLRFAGEWRDLQARFVDQPAPAAAAADVLITRVMEARGYPMKDFDTQANLVSVDHPDTVENYRFAHAVQQRAQTEQASTEDLREALLRYRSLFDELLRPEADGAAGDDTAGPTRPTNSNGRRPVAAEPEAQVPETTISETRIPDAGATGEQDGLGTEESDSLAAPAASDPNYRDQQIGR
jgi:hypothetical protein